MTTLKEGNNNMFRSTIKTSIQINAPARVVWQELTNIKDYPTWNPFLRSVSGTLAVGEQLTNIIQPEGGKKNTFYPRVLEVIPDKSLKWVGRLAAGPINLGFLFTGAHYFTLEEHQGFTLFHQDEDFSGLLVPLLKKQLDTTYRKGFESMNAALKARCEAQK